MAYYVNSFFLSLQYLWFVYFPIAYVVGLRRIYEREVELRAAVEAPPELAALHVGSELKGALWRDRQRQNSSLLPPQKKTEEGEAVELLAIRQNSPPN